MAKQRTRKLTAEEYKIIKETNTIPWEITQTLWTQAQLCGYGIYGKELVKDEDGDYRFEYEIGNSCD